jgi:hypothetical protein
MTPAETAVSHPTQNGEGLDETRTAGVMVDHPERPKSREYQRSGRMRTTTSAVVVSASRIMSSR